MYPIRRADERDLTALREIERAAGRCFTDIGMTFVAEDEPPSVAALRGFATDGRAWVSTDQNDAPVLLIRNAWELGRFTEENPGVEFAAVRERS